MNPKSLSVLLNFAVTQAIFAQILPQRTGNQNVPSNSLLINYNNLPGGNNLPTTNNLPIANNLAAPNTLSVLNSLPTENTFSANRLELRNKQLFSNGVANQGFNNNNALFQNNVLQTGSEFPVNNFLANNFPPVSKFPINNYLTNDLSAINNFPTNNYLSNSLPSANKVLFNNQLANDLPTVNNFPTNNFLSNSLPSANKVPLNNNFANDLPAVNNFPMTNSFANGLQTGSSFPTNNYLANGLPALNHFPVNNFLASGLPAVNNFPSNNYLGNSLQGQNTLPNTILTPINPLANSNNLANNGFTLNNGILSPGYFTSNAQPNINEIINTPVFANLANISPKAIQNLTPDGVIAKNALPAVNNLMSKILSDFIENNGYTSSKQTNNFMPENNMQIVNELSFNNDLSCNPQVNFPFNTPSSMPSCEDIPGTNVPRHNIFFNNAANNNNFLGNSLVTDSLLLPKNKYDQIPNVNLQDYPNSVVNNAQSFLTTIPATNMGNSNIDDIQHLQSNVLNCDQPFLTTPLESLLANDLTSTNFITNNMPCTNKNMPNINILSNLPKLNLPEFNSLSCTSNMPDINNIASSLPFVNNLNTPSNKLFGLGELTSLPIMNGLPVIGVTESVSVLNTAPMLYL